MEGPSLIILKEGLQPFIGKKILTAEGVAKKIDVEALTGKQLKRVETWGKHLLFQVGRAWYKSHFLLFGTYLINDRKDRNPTLRMRFAKGEVNFYSCSLKPLEAAPEDIYDWRTDLMSPQWDKTYVLKLVKERPDESLDDIILDQNVFTGAGNIIKSEALFLLKLPPETLVKQLSLKKLNALVETVHAYTWQFYEWKKEFVLRKNFRVYHKGTCPMCGKKITMKETGKKWKRRSYFCTSCQKLPKPKK